MATRTFNAQYNIISFADIAIVNFNFLIFQEQCRQYSILCNLNESAPKPAPRRCGHHPRPRSLSSSAAELAWRCFPRPSSSSTGPPRPLPRCSSEWANLPTNPTLLWLHTTQPSFSGLQILFGIAAPCCRPLAILRGCGGIPLSLSFCSSTATPRLSPPNWHRVSNTQRQPVPRRCSRHHPPPPAAHFTCRPRQTSPPACHNGSDHFCHSTTAAKSATPALRSCSPSSPRPRSAAPLAIIRPSPTSVFPTETYCNISPRPICTA